MDTFLETERLTLRRFTAADADLLVELDSDPAVMRYLTGGQATAPEEVREQILPGLLAAYARWDGKFGVFAAYARSDDRFVGWFLLRPEKGGPLDEVELGYRLRQAEWGHGYATEGSHALLARAFTELGVRTVWAATMALNLGSQRVLEKVGMTVTRTLPTPPDMQMVEGSEHGGPLYGITKEQWQQR